MVPVDGIEQATGRFELPNTHVLVTINDSFDRELGEFLILVVGFMLGLRLTIEGTGHLTATPTKPGKLVGFTPTDSELLHGLTKAAHFWNSTDPDQRKLAFAAIHWYLVAQSYRHQYEQLVWGYTVLDNLHRLTKLRSRTYIDRFRKQETHGRRPECLADEYNIPLPLSFAGIAKHGSTATNTGRLIKLRNELFHEARWLGEPIGYKSSDDAHEVLMNLRHFNSQLILGLLDIDCGFRAAVYCRAIHPLDARLSD